MSDDDLTEQGRRLASRRDDLIAAGANPADLLIPDAPAPSPVINAAIAAAPGRDETLREGPVRERVIAALLASWLPNDADDVVEESAYGAAAADYDAVYAAVVEPLARQVERVEAVLRGWERDDYPTPTKRCMRAQVRTALADVKPEETR